MMDVTYNVYVKMKCLVFIDAMTGTYTTWCICFINRLTFYSIEIKLYSANFSNWTVMA